MMSRVAFASAAFCVCTLCAAQGPVPDQGAAPAGVAWSDASRAAHARAPDTSAPPANPEALAQPQATPVFSIGKEYRVGANDLLDVEVLNLEKHGESAKRTVRVNAAGFITLPLVGPVAVAGLTQQEAEGQIAARYGEKYLQDPQVSVFIKEFTTERITIDGAVSKPGIYPLVGQMTLLRALALAGGFGQIANRQQVKLFRQEEGQRKVATYDVERIRAGTDPDPPIRGDDLIVVQRDSTRAILKDSVLRDVIDSINPFSVFR